jgi:hypothetical protein
MKIRTLVLVLLIGCIGCSNNAKENDNNSEVNKIWTIEDNSALSNIEINDTLKIFVEATDCGEYGGHREKICIYRKTNNFESKLDARIIIDSVNCEDIVVSEYNTSMVNDDSRAIFVDTCVVLSEDDEATIANFVAKILELKLKSGGAYSNAGVYYEITLGKSIQIDFWNSSQTGDSYYWKMRNKVFGKIIKSCTNKR